MRILLTDLFEDRRLFTRAMGLNNLSEQVNQVIGLGVGGVSSSPSGPPTRCWFDLATFLLGALVVALAIRAPAGGRRRRARDWWGTSATSSPAGATSPTTGCSRPCSALGLATSWAIAAPEAVALAYAAEAGQARYGGLLMAAPMAGAVVGLLVLGRWQPRDQNARIITLALLDARPAAGHRVPAAAGLVTGLLWFLNGALQAFMLPLQATFSLMVTPEMRGRVFGLAGALTVSATGIAFLVSGLVAQQLTAAAAVLRGRGRQPRRHRPAGRPLAPPGAGPGGHRGLRVLTPGPSTAAGEGPGARARGGAWWTCPVSRPAMLFLAVRPGQGTSPRRRAVALRKSRELGMLS